MNRAERRRLAKAEQKKAKEKTVNIKPSELIRYRQELQKNAEQTADEAVSTYFDVSTVFIAYVLHEEFGFGQNRIFRAIDSLNKMYAKYVADTSIYDEILEKITTATKLTFEFTED